MPVALGRPLLDEGELEADQALTAMVRIGGDELGLADGRRRSVEHEPHRQQPDGRHHAWTGDGDGVRLRSRKGL